jgi:hypothetical protein
MRKRTKVALLLAVGATVLLGVAGFLLRSASPITPRAYHRIKEGMTRQEVEAVLGLPPGDYRSRAGREDDSSWGMKELRGEYLLTHPLKSLYDEPPRDWRDEIWMADDFEIWAWFDGDGLVKLWCLEEKTRPRKVSLVERVRTWVGW